jgi:hypothetical protein
MSHFEQMGQVIQMEVEGQVPVRVGFEAQVQAQKQVQKRFET